MMKRIVLCMLFVFCLPMAFGGYHDGYLTAEDGYQYGFITWRSFDPPLIVDEGGD